MKANILFIGIENSTYFHKKSGGPSKKQSQINETAKQVSKITIYIEQTVDIDGHNVQLKIWNPSGQEQYARLRELAFYGIDTIIICFHNDDLNDHQMLRSYYEQIRAKTMSKKIKIFLLPKHSQNGECSPEDINWVYQLTMDDDRTEIIINQGDMLQKAGRNYLKQLKIAKANAEKCCSCLIY